VTSSPRVGVGLVGFERVPPDRQGVAPAKDASRKATVKASSPNPRNYFLESRITISAGLGVTTDPISMCSSTMSRKWSIYSNRFLNESTARHHSGLTAIRVQRSVFLRSSWFDVEGRLFADFVYFIKGTRWKIHLLCVKSLRLLASFFTWKALSITEAWLVRGERR